MYYVVFCTIILLPTKIKLTDKNNCIGKKNGGMCTGK